MISKNVSKFREKLSISQRELGRRVGISGQMISKIENNLATPSVDTLYKIASALGVSINDLVESIENSLSIDLISAIERAYISKNNGSPARDIFQNLSDDLELDYEMFHCYVSKAIIRKHNDDGTYTYEETNNKDFNPGEELPTQIQIKLIDYLANLDYPTFALFFTENQYRLNSQLKKHIINIVNTTNLENHMSKLLIYDNTTGELRSPKESDNEKSTFYDLDQYYSFLKLRILELAKESNIIPSNEELKNIIKNIDCLIDFELHKLGKDRNK